MGELQTWLNQNWFNVIQTLGIIATGLLAILTLSRETRARRFGDYLVVVNQHRELWREAYCRSELARVFQPDVDLIAAPVSVAEEEYLNLVIDHFHTGWLLARERVILRTEVLAADACHFFTLPLPRQVWESTLQGRDPKFVQFIKEALRSGSV